jgi:N-acyl-L-homoserine lactone synthetase
MCVQLISPLMRRNQPTLEPAMMLLIAPGYRNAFTSQIMEMHRLRCRVFKERLGWDVDVRDGLEVDRFDQCDPVYLLKVDSAGRVQGCVRLLPTLGPNMLRDTFSTLLIDAACPAAVNIWESSRFALDLDGSASRSGTLSSATAEMFAGMIEFGLARSLTDIVTVTDIGVERILRRAGWPLRRISEPTTLGNTKAVVGYLEISLQALASVRSAGGITGPVLWKPVVMAGHPA